MKRGREWVGVVLVLSYCVSTKFCTKWPLGCLLKPTYRANVVLFELQLKWVTTSSTCWPGRHCLHVLLCLSPLWRGLAFVALTTTSFLYPESSYSLTNKETNTKSVIFICISGSILTAVISAELAPLVGVLCCHTELKLRRKPYLV